MKASQLIQILSLDPEAEVKVAAILAGAMPTSISETDITNNPEAHAWIITPPKPCLRPSQLITSKEEEGRGGKISWDWNKD